MEKDTKPKDDILVIVPKENPIVEVLRWNPSYGYKYVGWENEYKRDIENGKPV